MYETMKYITYNQRNTVDHYDSLDISNLYNFSYERMVLSYIIIEVYTD